MPNPLRKVHHFELASSLAERKWFASLGENVGLNQGWERTGRNLGMMSCEKENGVAGRINQVSSYHGGIIAVENWCGW